MGNGMRLVLSCLAAVAAGCQASHDRSAGPSRAECTGDPDTAAVLDRIVSVSGPSDGYYRVILEDGATYLLDASLASSEGYAGIIESVRSRGEPIYLEYGRDDHLVVDVGLPASYRVLTITETTDGVAMTFDVSAAIHPMSRDLPCYDLFLSDLDHALANDTPVWITHDSLYHVIDVRPGA
jgi:hypothetical protein